MKAPSKKPTAPRTPLTALSTAVSIARCADYSQPLVDKAVEDSIRLLGGIGEFVGKGDNVLLKVNLLIGKDPKYAVTTHPSIVRAVIKLVRAAGGKPSVGDSPSAASFESFDQMTANAGLKQLCEGLEVPLIELDEPEEIKVDGRMMKSFMLSGRLKGFDVIINLPKLKTHSLTMYTGAVKNLYGCISGRRKALYHTLAQDGIRFSELLLDLHRIIRPKLSIMDGIIGMEGDGPAAGNPRKIGVIVAGRSPLAVDVVSSEIVGMRRDVPLLDIALSRKMPEADLNNLTLLGARIADVRIRDFKKPKQAVYAAIPQNLRKLFRPFLDRRPVVAESVCTGCASCFSICPKKAITMVRKKEAGEKSKMLPGKKSQKSASTKPSFDYNLCIRCYCCQEVCPVKAISLKETLATRIIRRLLR
jgi:uncharacterized protein (DUF362 family)